MKLFTSKTRVVALWLLIPTLMAMNANAQGTLVLSLDKALEIALSDNPSVRIADQEVAKKKYARKGSYAALFPQVNFNGDYSRTLKKQVMYLDVDMGGQEIPGMDQMSNGIEVGRDNNWSVGFNAAMPLVNASLWKSLSISGTEVEMAIEQARSSRIEMVNQIKNSYYGVLLANDSYLVFKENYDNTMANYLDIKQKYGQGTVAEYDLIRAEVAVHNSEPTMLEAQNSLELAKWQLKALLGLDLEMKIECEGKLADFESNLYGDFLSADTSLHENTALRQLDIQDMQLKQTLKMQQFDYLPTLSLVANYSWTSMNNDFKFNTYKWNPYSTIGVSLSIPIFSGGSKHNHIKQTQVSMNQLSLQRGDTERHLRVAVKQQMDVMKTCVKQYDAARNGVAQANRGYDISHKRYDTGAGTLLELNDSELSLTQAKLNLNNAIYNYMVAQATLDKLTGKQQDIKR